jgi:multiple sugar transport system ATP-binding protein
MDEPLSNLDAKLRVQMRSEIKRFHHNLGATIIYVTHDQLEAVTMADKMAVMNGGCAASSTTPPPASSPSPRRCSWRASWAAPR